MKMLFDQNLSFRLCGALDDAIPGSSQACLCGLAGADDRIIWQYAKDNAFVLVTQDSDFADMAALYEPPPKVIWLRCGNQPSAVIEKILRLHSPVIAAFEQDPIAACLELL